MFRNRILSNGSTYSAYALFSRHPSKTEIGIKFLVAMLATDNIKGF